MRSIKKLANRSGICYIHSVVIRNQRSRAFVPQFQQQENYKMRFNPQMTPNELALANCSLAFAELLSRARLATQNWPERSEASYREAQQVMMLRDYLHRITYNLPH